MRRLAELRTSSVKDLRWGFDHDNKQWNFRTLAPARQLKAI